MLLTDNVKRRMEQRGKKKQPQMNISCMDRHRIELKTNEMFDYSCLDGSCHKYAQEDEMDYSYRL